MATYQFSTITATQALGLTAGDTLAIDQGTAVLSSVAYIPGAGGAADTISLTIGARSVVFSSALSAATKTFADGSQLYVGGTGDDSATFLFQNDAMFGGLGNDTLISGNGDNIVQGNQGNDALRGGSGSDTIYGGADNDFILTGASPAGGFANFVNGNKGTDTVNGSLTDADTLLGGQGNDLIGAYSITLDYNQDNPVTGITGGRGGGTDFLNGNLGDDTIVGGAGDDTIYGEDGNDLIIDSNSYITGTGGRNTIDAGVGNDTVAGSANDSILMGAGDDLGVLSGGSSNSAGGFLDGGAGNDALVGGDGSDAIFGGTGDDTIDGFDGPDSETGGAGADLFQFYGDEARTAFAGLDRILDWAAEDKLSFTSSNDVEIGAGTSANYAEITAATYDAALAAANAQVAGGVVNYVAAQVGADVFVFADSEANNGVADSAIILVGKTLADIAFTNMIFGI